MNCLAQNKQQKKSSWFYSSLIQVLATTFHLVCQILCISAITFYNLINLKVFHRVDYIMSWATPLECWIPPEIHFFFIDARGTWIKSFFLFNEHQILHKRMFDAVTLQFIHLLLHFGIHSKLSLNLNLNFLALPVFPLLINNHLSNKIL